MRHGIWALLLVWGCSSSSVIDAVPATGGAGGTAGGGATGGASSTSASSSSSGAGGMGGFTTSSSSGEGGMIEWENDCTNTGVTLQVENEPLVELNDPCSDYAAQYHDGPVAYEFHGGFVGNLSFSACDLQNGRVLLLGITDVPGDPEPVIHGEYHSGSYPWDVLSGELLQTGGAGEVGQVIEGTITLSLTANTPATGTLRICRIPDQYGI